MCEDAFMDRKLKKKKCVLLMALILGIVIISFASLTISKYISNIALIETNGTYLPQIAKQASLSFSKSIDADLKVLEGIAGNSIFADEGLSIEDKLEKLKNEVKRTDAISISIADKNGVTRDTDGKLFNIKNENNFKKAILGENYVSDPVININDGKSIVIYSVPIKTNGEIVGVLSSIRDGNEISHHSTEIKFGNSGRAYVINGEGTVIAHQNKNLVLNRDNTIKHSENDSSLKELAVIEKKMINKENGYGKYNYEGKEKYIGYAPINNTDWSIAIVIEKDEMIKNANVLKSGIVTAASLFIALGIIIVLVVILKLILPLKKVDRKSTEQNLHKE